MSPVSSGIRSSVVKAGGHRTRFLEAGDESAPTVVLIHDGSYGADASVSWDGMLPELAARYHVFAPDLLGWGGTDKTVYFDRSHYEFRIEHIARFCEALGIDRPAHFVGSSFGGSLVLRAAVEQPLRWPFGSGVSLSGTGGPYRVLEAFKELTTFDGTIEDSRRLMGLLVADADAAAFEDQVERRHQGAYRPGHWEAMLSVGLRRPTNTSVEPPEGFPESLADTPVPLLLVEGAKDRLLEPGWAEKLAGFGAHVRAVTMDCAHLPNLERPDELLALLVEFFDSNP